MLTIFYPLSPALAQDRGNNSGGSSASQEFFKAVIINEMLATEIIRTLAGTIGLVLSVPLAVVISVWWFKRLPNKPFLLQISNAPS